MSRSRLALAALLTRMIAAQSMEARAAAELPAGDGWWFEPKWDGFRCLAFRDGPRVRLQARSGKPLDRYFPEVVDLLAALAAGVFVIDGELVARTGDRFSFETLQMRLHPAESRIRRLARETPASLAAFDMLVDERAVTCAARPCRSAARRWPPSSPASAASGCG